MAQRVGQGGPITVDATFRDGAGTLVDPVDPTIAISDSNSVVVIPSATPTRTSVGRFSYTFTVPISAATGVWDVRWRGTINGSPVIADDVFEVVAAGVIAVGATEDEVDTLVSVDELVGYMSNIKLGAGQYQAAEYVLEGVEAEIEAFIGRPLKTGPRTETTYMTDANAGFIRLAGTPVTSVESVSILGQTLNTDAYQIAPGGLYLLMPYLNTPALFITSGPSGITTPIDPIGVPILVSYTGGLPPDAVRLLRIEILRIAAKEMTNRHDDTLSVKGTERNDKTPVLPYGLTDEARTRLSRFKRRVAV